MGLVSVRRTLKLRFRPLARIRGGLTEEKQAEIIKFISFPYPLEDFLGVITKSKTTK